MKLNDVLDKMCLVIMIVAAVGVCGSLLSPERASYADTGWEGATRVENGSYFDSAQVTIATTGVTATTILSAKKNRPCVYLHNTDGTYKIYIGSSTEVSVTTGYALEVNTGPGSSIRLYNFNGSLFGYGSSGSAALPVLAVGECRN